MDLAGACMLSVDEGIIFNDGNLGRHRKLVLTNKRLIFLRGMHEAYQKEDEISIDDIKSIRYDTESGAIMLQLKNGEKDVIQLVHSDGFADVLVGADPVLDVSLQATIDRWVNRINQLMMKAPTYKMIQCKYCGAKNRSTETTCGHCGALLPI